MRLVDGGDDLPEEVASVWFPESSAGSHVAVHVPVAGGEHQGRRRGTMELPHRQVSWNRGPT